MRRASIDYSLTSGEIFDDRDLPVLETRQEGRHFPRFAVGGLEDERATGPKPREGSRRDRLGHARGDERLARLVARDLGLEPIDLGRVDVGRVRDDQVEGALQSGKELSLDELDAIRESGSRPVLIGHGQSALRGLRGDDARPRMLIRDGERDRARADADVEDARLSHIGEELEAALDDRLGLRPGDEHARIDSKAEPAETPLAQEVGERLAPLAPLDELAEAVLRSEEHTSELQSR